VQPSPNRTPAEPEFGKGAVFAVERERKHPLTQISTELPPNVAAGSAAARAAAGPASKTASQRGPEAAQADSSGASDSVGITLPETAPEGTAAAREEPTCAHPRGPTALATYTDVDSENSCLRFGHCIPMRNIGSMPSLAALARLHQSVNVRGLRSGPEWIGAALAGGCMADRPLNCGHSLIIDSGLSQPSDQSKTGRGWLLTAADFEVPGRLSGSALGDITYPSDVKSWGPRCSKQSGNIGYSAVSSA